jgi:hypothetical protein
MGGPQTRPFLLHPAHLPVPAEPLVGAEAVHRLLRRWREACNGSASRGPRPDAGKPLTSTADKGA